MPPEWTPLLAQTTDVFGEVDQEFFEVRADDHTVEVRRVSDGLVQAFDRAGLLDAVGGVAGRSEAA